jgi:uncharacterized membrane protein (DUF485 family)
MTIVGLLLVLVIFGVVISFVPMDARVKQAVVAIGIILAVLCLLDILGLVHLPGARLK